MNRGRYIMKFQPKKRLRMPDYNYGASGAYFCTLCVHRMHRHKQLLARCDGETLRLNRFGALVENCWFDIPNHRPAVTLDAFIVMPNHVHLVLFLDAPLQTAEGAMRFGPLAADSLGTVIGCFKAAAKRAINALRGEPTVVWQPRFYDHVVRSESELLNIRRYIDCNPSRWLEDRCHPEHPDFDLAWQGITPHNDL